MADRGLYHFHGWLELHTRCGELDDASRREALQATVFAVGINNERAELLVQNGTVTLVVNGGHNRRRSHDSGLYALIREALRLYGASYGLIYEYDETNCVVGGTDVWSVVVVRDGGMVRRADPFLSPMTPAADGDPLAR